MEKATTLRELVKMLEADNPKYLDMPLSFCVHSATKMHSTEYLELSHDLWAIPRSNPELNRPEEKGHVTISLFLQKHSLTKRRK